MLRIRNLGIVIASVVFLSLAAGITHTFTTLADKSIYVLRLAPAGGSLAAWSDAVLETLEQNDYSAQLVALNSYQEGRAWLNANPNKKAIYVTFSDNVVFDKHYPNHPASTKLVVDENTLVTIIGKWWNFICGHTGKNDSIESLLAASEAKVGVRSFPTSLEAARAHMKAIGADVKMVGFASGRDQMQAFVSGDLDYIIMSTESLARGLNNATCFATSAPIAIAKEYMPTRVAYESLNPDLPFNGFGLWPVLVAENTDNEALKAIFQHNPGQMYQKLQSTFVPEHSSIAAQLDEFAQMGKSLTAVLPAN